MPNWVFTSYVVTGDKEQLEEIYNIMTELEDMESPGLHDSEFGPTWLGNLIIKLGGDWQNINCRGYWDNLEYYDDKLQFTVEGAWGELDEVRYFLEEKFPGIKIYYRAEDSDMGIYTTNDDTEQYFPEKYYLWVSGDDLDEENSYHDSLKSLIREIENITGYKNLRTYTSCEKALEKYSRNHSDFCYRLLEYEVIPD